MALVEIENHILENPCWQSADQFCTASADNLDIWKIRISSVNKNIGYYKTLMTDQELLRASRYLKEADQNRMIVGRGATRLILSAYLKTAPGNIKFGEGVNGKPFIKTSDNYDLYFNLSHSYDYVAVSICASEVGIDIEKINLNFDYSDIIATYFNHDEINYINESHSAERFFTLWTRKEALLKATAKGIDDDLTKIKALDGRHYLTENIFRYQHKVSKWSVTTIKLLNADYIISAAACNFTPNIRLWNFDKVQG